MKHISLFSGIGGFDLAAERAGWKNVASCEINPFGRRVLEYYWPDAYHHDDIHTLTAERLYEKANITPAEQLILTGGFPCQPYSAAGKRRGAEDERHLWPEYHRLIKELKPTWVVGENVRGIVNWNGGLVFDEVQADLENAGYSTTAYILPAAGVGAPHQRYRVWFVAYAGHKSGRDKCGCKNKSDRELLQGEQQGCKIRSTVAGCCRHRATTNADGLRRTQEHELRRPEISEQLCKAGDVTDTSHKQLQRSKQHRSAGKAGQAQTNGRQSGRSVCTAWQEFPTQPPVCGRDDGLSAELDGITFSKWRNESVKAYGNAIVPEVAYQIFKAINQYEES